jgi:Na+/H+ antiporter NhaD/arsenite permease-like protein
LRATQSKDLASLPTSLRSHPLTPIVRHTPLTLWHLLSLDAPTIAALWICFIARCCGISLPFTAPAAMFIAVWILYAADRLLDAQNPTTPSSLEERHHFHHRHRTLFVTMIAFAAVALAALTPELFPRALRLYALLGALLAGWFLLIHTRLAHERRLPKELAVGLFFAAAIFIPTIARRPDLRLHLLAPAILFATVCALNCMYLYAWEHPGDRPNANWTTHFATHHLTHIAIVIFVAALIGVIWLALPSHRTPAVWPIPAACAGSALLLLLLDRNRAKLSPLHLRAAADLALLTPLLLVPFIR